MSTMFVRHEVTDFAAWKQVYDTLGAMQQQGGVTAQTVFQGADNPNDVTVTHEFATIEAARRFASSDALREAMAKAGVAGAPTIWFTTKV